MTIESTYKFDRLKIVFVFHFLAEKLASVSQSTIIKYWKALTLIQYQIYTNLNVAVIQYQINMLFRKKFSVETVAVFSLLKR